ncbi:MAG: hypothetical protein ACI9ZX_001548 [Algoriphagus sp.]|jgi:hypothetical protein
MKSKVILRLNSITMDVEFRGEKGRNELGCPNIGSAPVSDFTNQDNRHRLVWYGRSMDTADPCKEVRRSNLIRVFVLSILFEGGKKSK